ncbi:MAG: hypothetical protein FWC44_00930 [Methanomassiliicoccaceae archaeon]|nr:hypothetical protein [Methanomassiliicoccaceae archaeon]
MELIERTYLPVQRIFYEGEVFTAHVIVSNLIRSAKESIVLLDNDVDESVLLTLSERSTGASAEIITNRISPQLRQKINEHNEQFEEIHVHESDRLDDCFLIIDNDVYRIGPPLKDLGKKMSVFYKMEIKKEEMLKKLQ